MTSADRGAEARRRWNRERTAEAQEIGEIPLPQDPDRRAAAIADYGFFCRTYFSAAFTLPWSPFHEKAADKINKAVKSGGVFAFAMPRGSGKTTMCEWATLWAILSGQSKYVLFVGASEATADKRLKSLKSELRFNDLLLADFPEVCIPVAHLDGEARRAAGQKFRGEPTNIEWTQKRVVLATIQIDQCLASGSVIEVIGITGDIRGRNHKLASGEIVRPSLAVCDDPQTRESAMSVSQSATREATLAGDVAYLAGPGKAISILMPCTVINPGDMADKMLDRSLHPEWQGERTKMVLKFPKEEKLWDEYRELREQSFRDDGNGSEATEFYRKHREQMDAGAEVSWPERFNDGELSSLQHAMNLRFRDEAAFFAEYQNEPLATLDEEDEDLLTADQIAVKTNGINHRLVPHDCSHLTAFIDVQQKLLYFVVIAWTENFTGHVIDYGCWPDQKRRQFTLRDAKISLAMKFPKAGFEGSIYGGLEKLTDELLGGEWRRDDGAVVNVDRCMIDANWGRSTDVVYQFCRQSAHSAVLTPSHGKFVGAASIPFSDYKRKPGERVGHNWRIPNVRGKRAVRHVVYDTNYWKSFIQARLSVSMGDRGCLSLYGRKPHRLFASHLVAEYRVRTEGRGRTVDEWKHRPERPDNHWLDCVVGCAVGASMQGVTLQETEVTAPQPKKSRTRMSMAERRARKRGVV